MKRLALVIVVLLSINISNIWATDYYFGNDTQFDKSIPTPEEFFGFPIGSELVRYDRVVEYFRLLDNLMETEIRILAVLDNPKQYNITHGMPVKDPINNAYQTSWNRVTGSGVLTQVLGKKIHEVEDAITVLFSNGLIMSNVLERQLETNANGIHVLENLLTERGKDFVKFLKD